MGSAVDDMEPFINSSFIHCRNVEEAFQFERIDMVYWVNFMLRHWDLGFYAGAIYAVTILGLEKIMKNKPPFDLRTPLILWNAGLGIFSIVGFIRSGSSMMPYLGEDNGVFRSICERDRLQMTLGFWGVAFGFSKFVELGDTLFIVLRKRPLQVLQWYHHIVTVIYNWLTAPYVEPVTRWFVVVNYGVHAVMYPYFALKMAGVKVPKVVTSMVTLIQFLQMIFALLGNFVTIGLKGLGYSCYRTPISIYLSLFVYGSFAILFGHLFVKSVLRGTPTKSKGSKVL